VTSAAKWPAHGKGSKRSCELVPAGAAIRRTRSTSSSERQNRTASSPRRSGASRTLQPPTTAGAVRQTCCVRLRSGFGRVGAIIGVAAQELPCPAARVEFRHVPICGRKPRYIELPHWVMVENGVNPGSWNSGIAFQKLKWQPRLSADNRRRWEPITERCDGFAVADRCNPHLPSLSA
jgi:hypothetical protein